MDDVAIKVENISKVFKLPHEKNTSIKSAAINFYKRKKTYELQHALEDVSFEVKKGEFFGIVGRNGSGKSTLLKLLAGIYTPTKGQIHVNGKLTPFIELGVGFNPELTGRENVFLNGALLGFNRKEMQAMYKDIVEFAELEKFMDQKLKNYSSGMQVRLAFSIAIRAKSGILVLDEVLAVGDEAFQRKCISVFEDYKAARRTIVLVTHDMSIVEKFCTRALLIKDGQTVKLGTPELIAKMYSKFNQDQYIAHHQSNKGLSTNKIKVELLDKANSKLKYRYIQNEDLTVRLSWDADDVKNVGIAILKRSGEYVFGPNTLNDRFTLKPGAKEIFFTMSLTVSPGEYFLMAGLFGNSDKELIEFEDHGPTLFIEKSKDAPQWAGIAYLDHSWSNKND